MTPRLDQQILILYSRRIILQAFSQPPFSMDSTNPPLLHQRWRSISEIPDISLPIFELDDLADQLPSLAIQMPSPLTQPGRPGVKSIFHVDKFRIINPKLLHS